MRMIAPKRGDVNKKIKAAEINNVPACAGTQLAEKSSFSDFYTEAIFSPLSSLGSAVLIGCAVALAGVLIYIFDRFISLKKAERLDDRQKCRVALFMAVLTAPYSFFVPLNWLY